MLEESSRGLFGIGGRPAKVRLTLLAPPPRKESREAAPAERPDKEAGKKPRRRRRKKPAAADSPAASSGQPRNQKSARPAEPRPPRAPGPDSDYEGDEDDIYDDDLADEETPLFYSEEHARPAPEDDEEARSASETLQELLTRMDIRASVQAYYVDPADESEVGPLVLQVTGKDLGTLIGRRGETLAALQYVTRLIVSRDLQRRTNLVVDVEHYKARREKRLHSLALRMAKQAAQNGRTVSLEPMPAYERRIIHLSLRGRSDVYTQSVGEGEARKVTIVPVRDRPPGR